MSRLGIAFSYLGAKYYLFGLRVWLRSAFRRYDFCQATDVMSLFAARAFAARGIPLLFDVNEIPDPFERQGRHFVAAAPALKQHLSRAFARDFPRAGAVTTTSTAMAEFIAERFGRPASVLRNAREALDAAPSRTIRDELGAPDDAKIIVYPCTAAPYLGVETGIDMMRLLPANSFLVFVGRFVTDEYRQQIERLIRFHGLAHRVRLKGVLSEESYLPYIAGADFGLVPLSFAYRNQKLVLPWRVVDLVAAGVPLVATPNEEILRIARDFDIGDVASGTDAESLAAAVLSLAAATPARLATIKRDLAALQAHLSPERQRTEYRSLLASLARKESGRAAFIFNIALRANRRLIEFIDEACALGWRVDLYSVRGPDRHLFQFPDRVRCCDIADGWLDKRRAAKLWLRFRHASAARPAFALVKFLGDAAAGIWFGAKQTRRAFRYARFVRAATQREGPWDMVIAADIFACPAGLVARGPRTVSMFDATETPDLRRRSSRYLRRIPGPLRWGFARCERLFVQRASLIAATSHALNRSLRRRYPAKTPDSFVTVRNVAPFEREDVLTLHPEPSLRRRLGLPEADRLVVSPCGISAETGALLAARTLRLLPPEYSLVFIGRFSDRGTEMEARQILARDCTAHRCFFIPEEEYSLYLRYLAECDLGLILFDPSIDNLRLAAPNRFFDLVAMEVPFVATPLEEIAPLVRRAKIGTLVKELRPAAVAHAILDISARSDNERNRANRRRLARFYAWAKERERLVDAISAQAGPLPGKKIALLTLRNGARNRRIRLIAAALCEAGAEVHVFDTSIARAPSSVAAPGFTTLELA